MTSRRDFLTQSSRLALAGSAAVLPVPASPPTQTPPSPCGERISLNGSWHFRLDPERSGETKNWNSPETDTNGWVEVTVPHTWQIEEASAEYYGVAWYRRTFDAPAAWQECAVRVEFEAVFHSAVVWVNGKIAGQHLGKGYTAFALDIASLLRFGSPNVIAVKVDNAFADNMLPRGTSSDWTHDGGVYRPVALLITPKVFIERADVDAVPDTAAGNASIEVAVAVRNTSARQADIQLGYRVIEKESGLAVLERRNLASRRLPSGATETITLPHSTLDRAKLWHFDHPHLYELVVEMEDQGRVTHRFETAFGIRSFEVRQGGFYLNGERVRLMGVERMAGSNPEFGMAEPSRWLDHDHDDLKELNCVFTRVHWQQDRRVLDYCDRHGILIQTEVPTWGGGTFRGMQEEPSREIMENGLEQLREMIVRDRNHPSIFAWGLCNEIGGQNRPAYRFAQRMYEEARKLDPRRLRSYASNSLQKTPGSDVAGLMDFIEWNEYYESWMKGTAADMRRNLEEIHKAFPDKPIVISEYGYCACTADRPEGDARRIEILSDHDRVFHQADYVGGLIFFCYNDYRTHVGDKGSAVMKQRVHGVVDVYGARKPSFEALRAESSPVESLEVKGLPGSFTVAVRTRSSVPSYTLTGYKLRAVLYGAGDIPLERREVALPALPPGGRAGVEIRFKETAARTVRFDVLRPTGFSAFTRVWKP